MRIIPFILVIVLLSSCSSEYGRNQDFVLADGEYKIGAWEHEYELGIVFDSIDSIEIVSLLPASGNKGTVWQISRLDKKEYTIQSGGKYLTLEDGNISFSPQNNAESQIWVIHRFKDQKYKILNKAQLDCLCLSDEKDKQADLSSRICNNYEGEYWSLIESYNSPHL